MRRLYFLLCKTVDNIEKDVCLLINLELEKQIVFIMNLFINFEYIMIKKKKKKNS
jgi:hypothetical protein